MARAAARSSAFVSIRLGTVTVIVPSRSTSHFALTIVMAMPPQRLTAILNYMVQYSAPQPSAPTIDRAFAALADPNRRAVLERLGVSSATISELAEPFEMSLTGMKKHIRLLEEANLVSTEKIGRVPV